MVTSRYFFFGSKRLEMTNRMIDDSVSLHSVVVCLFGVARKPRNCMPLCRAIVCLFAAWFSASLPTGCWPLQSCSEDSVGENNIGAPMMKFFFFAQSNS